MGRVDGQHHLGHGHIVQGLGDLLHVRGTIRIDQYLVNHLRKAVSHKIRRQYHNYSNTGSIENTSMTPPTTISGSSLSSNLLDNGKRR